MIDMQEADLVIIALEYHDEGVYKLQSLQNMTQSFNCSSGLRFIMMKHPRSCA